MIIVDTALKKLHEQGKPIQVAMVGAGFMAKGIALQIAKYVPGMNLAAISNRHVEKAGNVGFIARLGAWATSTRALTTPSS